MAKDATISLLPPYRGNQLKATGPDSQIRLSASAGTGKTQVLTARVLRLLLHGAKPESILCLTFTKAGAAEMADRIHERLGAWVTMPDSLLAIDLKNLGEDIAPDAREEARNLFAQVLDARGSGLRIQTIHSFCQTLLASFPAEAGLAPGFRAIEGREEIQLASEALSDMVANAQAQGDLGLIAKLRSMAMRMGEERTRETLRRCAAAPDAMDQLGIGIDAKVRRWLSGGIDDIQSDLEARCGDVDSPIEELSHLRDANRGWGTATGQKYADIVDSWLLAVPAERSAMLKSLSSVWLKADGDFRKPPPKSNMVQESAEIADAWYQSLAELVVARDLAPSIADALTVGQAYSRAYADAKSAAAVVDFNDLIRHTERLLTTDGIGDWIRYKLDQSIDHVLVDEAQDTNRAQWAIVSAVTEEFFAGAGAKGDKRRTLFLVGDHKQAIYGFQGTNPAEFNAAARHFAERSRQAGQPFLDLPLNESYRSGQPILDVTDSVIAEIGHEAMGLSELPLRHVSQKACKSGRVVLLPPVTDVVADEQDGSSIDDDEETWLADSELKWARQLSELVREWIQGGAAGSLYLEQEARFARAEDIMILVRKRGELARLIVSRLYEAGVPIAGVDRLRLNAPIAVQDLLACIRFALQPDDDLTLASLLVSPLVGWSQDDLYERGKNREKKSFWEHLGDAKPDVLKAILGQADLTTPYRFLENILSGPIAGRRKLIARLGEEARDPIEELLNAALTFESGSIPSLQLFVDWFDRGDVEIKRDPAKPEQAVRVMTVHGAKGLQAPIVVLADATLDPVGRKNSHLDWSIDDELTVPIPRPKPAHLVGTLKSSAELADRNEAEEHFRLLYVAMTRAEEHLYIGGALRPRQQMRGMVVDCWHVRVAQAMQTLGAIPDGDRTLVVEQRGVVPQSADSGTALTTPSDVALPDWMHRNAPTEARPTRPLAPSALETPDAVADSPIDSSRRNAARRGILLHSLFERLPSVEFAQRHTAALRWLAAMAQDFTTEEQREIADVALATINLPSFSDVFGPLSLAEVPIAGVVAGRVIAGTVDRILVRDHDVLVVDFKTGRRVPASLDAVPAYHQAQMAAYAAVLETIFPGKSVRAALLYSSGPSMIELPQEALDKHKPGFSEAQEDFAGPA